MGKRPEAPNRGRKDQEIRQRRERKRPARLDYSADQVNETLFPVGRRMRLSTGESFEIKPWSISTFGEMTRRIPDTIERALSAPDDAPAVAAIFDSVSDELVYMVAVSIERPEAFVRELSVDDLLTLTLAVWDICVAGPAAKMAGLLGRIVGTIGGPAALGTKTPPVSSSRSTT